MPVSKEELDAWNAEADRKIQLEQIENNLTPEQFEQKERAKSRWSGSWTRGMLQSVNDLAGDFNAGVTSLLGPDVQDWFAEIGIGRRHDQLPYMGIVGNAADAMGQSMTMAATLGAGLTSQGARTGFELLKTVENPSLTGRIGADLMKTIESNPKMFLGAEAAGGFGSGAAMGAAQAGGAPPEALPYAGVLGGIGLGAIPILGFNFGRRAINWSLGHVAPWLDGGETLAAIRLQRLAADPHSSAAKVLKSPEGVTPGRASEDKNLMALENRILEDDPTMEADFQAALERARNFAAQQLRDFNGHMRQPGEWERSVIEKVSAPGTTITMSDPHTMLKQARKSFDGIYNDFAGYPVKPQIDTEAGEIPLEQVFKIAATDETILASDSERKLAQSILQDEFSRLKPAADADPTINSEKFLFVRQMLRDKISDLTAKRQRGPHITARILSNAEAAITKIFQQQLPEEALSRLQQIDDHYNTYRVVEQAVTTAGERKLSPEALGQAVRQLTPKTGGDLRKLARAGRNVSSVLNDPRAAKLMVQGQPGNVRRQLQSDYFHEMWSRSLTKELNDGDAPLVSGERYLQQLVAYKDAGKALGVAPEEYNRAVEIAKTIKMMEAKSPQALRQTLEDGPASIMQLMATLIGAKSGQHLASLGGKGGLGSSLVMSQFMSQRARRILSTVFRDDASDLLIKATKNKELYAALLTKGTAKAQEQEKAARVIASWLATTEDFNDDDEPKYPKSARKSLME